MVSNNTDYAYGETRGQNQIEEDAIAGADLAAGDLVYITGTTDGGLTTVAKLPTTPANEHQPFGIVRFPVKSGKVATLLLRGITRSNYTASAAIAVNARVAQEDGRLKTVADGTSKSFAVNIGGALTANDTGLMYFDFIAGFCGGGAAA